jgi:hypothetical protein
MSGKNLAILWIILGAVYVVLVVSIYQISLEYLPNLSRVFKIIVNKEAR